MSRARLTVLSQDEIESIHAATMDLLESVGVIVRAPGAVKLLTEAGGTRVEDSDRVLLPAALVQEAVKNVPKKWTWYAREAKYNVRVGEGGRTRLGPGATCCNFIDFDTGKARTPTAEDANQMVRLMDALEHVDINYSPVEVTEDGSTPHSQELSRMVEDVQNTSKLLLGPCYDGEAAKTSIEFAKILAGGAETLRKHPMIGGYYDPVGPLIHDRKMTESMMEYASMGQPAFLTSADLAGASAPATLAGTLVQQNAEILSAVLIAYLVNRKVPLIYGSVSGIMDMQVGNAAFGGPEFGLISIASVQLSHYYGLPCSTGGQSDSKIHDAQAALEKGMTLLASAMAGADFVDLFFGSYEGFNAASLEQVVIDHDIAGFAFRYARGIEVNDETLALDLLREVGPGGSFLSGRGPLEYTRKWMKTEYYLPFLVDRRSRFRWGPTQGRTLLQEAHERAKKILAEHEPTPVDPDILKAINALLDRVKREESRITSKVS